MNCKTITRHYENYEEGFRVMQFNITKFINFLRYRNLNLNSVAFSPQANNTDRATAACRRSYCQLLWIEGVAWSAQRIPTAVNSVFLNGAATFTFK
jgi:hypothetical protein